MGAILLGADQVGVASVDVTPTGQSVTLTIEALGLTVDFDLTGGWHNITNPDLLVGFGVTRLLPEHENSWAVQVKFRALTETLCEIVWSASEGSLLENILLTAE